MRHGRMTQLIRRSAETLLLLGGFGVSLQSPVLAQDASCAVPAPACQAPCADDVYKRAADCLARQLNQSGGCAPACAPAAACDGAGNMCQPEQVFGDCSGNDCPPLGEPWKLSKENGFDFFGWVQMGYQNNPDGAFTGNGASPAFGPAVVGNQRGEWGNFNLNQLYLVATKVADGSKGWDWGFRVDGMYGVDGNEGQSFGNVLPGRWDYLNGFGGPPGLVAVDPVSHGPYEFAIPQLYAEVAYCSLSVKLGHFYTPVGYEVVTSPDNFFLSRQLTFNNSEPFTHTGALGTYKVNDKLSILGGWALGWDTGYTQFSHGSMGLWGMTYAASDKTSFTYMAGAGDFGWRGNGWINSFIMSNKWTDKFMTVTQFDVLGTDIATDGSLGYAAGDFVTTGIAGDSTGLINYAFYELCECLKVGARLEWYRADAVSHHTFTYGLNYKPHANVVIRPEMRHNWSPGNDVTPFNEDIFGIDVIWRF